MLSKQVKQQHRRDEHPPRLSPQRQPLPVEGGRVQVPRGLGPCPDTDPGELQGINLNNLFGLPLYTLAYKQCHLAISVRELEH